MMKFYDAHVHFFYDSSSDELEQIFRDLEGAGMAGFSALVFAEIPREMDAILNMVPGLYHKNVTLKVLENQRDPFPMFKRAGSLRIIPYADARFLQNGVEQKIRAFKQRGFEGVKLLYVPEEDADIRVKGMVQTFGRSVRQSEKVTSLIIDSASSQGMSILFHADLRRYGGFVTEMVRGYPEINFNIPHFGFSRKEISPLLDTYSNCYTDISSLTPFMEKDPVPYRNFIKQHQDRILFGSDVVIGHPGPIQSMLNFVIRFLGDEELSHKVASENYLRFHGISSEL